MGSRRPIPWRCDSIGPWLTALGFLSWLGSVTSSAIVFLCSHSAEVAAGGEMSTTTKITLAGFLASILFAEHFYFAVQILVDMVMSKMESPGLQKERKERFQMKKNLLGDLNLESSQHKRKPSSAPRVGITDTANITRETLEDEAREQSLQGHGTAEDE